jgi:putative membrane-bound dehydrogenase-like protein
MRSLLTLGLVLGLSVEARPQGFAPNEAVSRMKPAGGLSVKLYAAEPDVRQPIVVKFDDRGRLWTVQYLQYPNPAGLKRVKIDRWSRTVYDRIPDPPPKGPRGDDRITICEDTDGDGRADRFKDFVTGLNLCTSLEFGHGGVYVLQMPYLLFYPDRNRDDVPDADPEVLLSGFGMEDAQSVPNHLTWGPEGWLYGVTGSTSSNLVRGVEFQQAVWRFHPLSKRFELFCEGGGNLFGLTFDADGNLFFSSNGNDLAYHAVQGGYYRKNFSKHGPLHKPYTYGFFEHVPYDQPVAGPRPGGMVYLGETLPVPLQGTFLCCDFLQHSASSWRLTKRGSTFAAKYGGRLLDSRDTWFCAPDLCQGPDGAVYVCDFHDQRTAHPDPDAQWDRSNGRIYRVAPLGMRAVRDLDLDRKSSLEMVELLRHPNGWHRAQARAGLATRRDTSTLPALATMSRQTDDARLALQGLWGLYVSGGFDDLIAADLLRHSSESIRAWTVRLLGDEGKVSPGLASRLIDLAETDTSVTVRCQLAATARRLPGADGLPIVESLLRRGLDRDDPYLPLMLWWAVEARAMTEPDRLIAFYGRREGWGDRGIREITLNLIRRYAAEGTAKGYDTCERILSTASVRDQADAFATLELGLAERSVAPGSMGMAGLFGAIAIPERRGLPERRFEPLTGRLADTVKASWLVAPTDLLRMRLATRAQVPGASAAVLAEAAAPSTAGIRRIALLGILADFGTPGSVRVALAIVEGDHPLEVKSAALDLLARHGDESSAARLLEYYPKCAPSLQERLRGILLGRPGSALALLERVDRKEIDAGELPIDQLRQVSLHGDPKLDALLRKHWGSLQPGTAEEKLAEIRRLSNDLRAGSGDPVRGKELFTKNCASCHSLFREGGGVGPDLTGIARDDITALLASIVDPAAVIRPPYLQYVAATTTGRVVTGVIAAQDNASLTLVDARNAPSKILREEIVDLRQLPTSIMPENLLKPLSPQDIRDLFRYLQDRPR